MKKTDKKIILLFVIVIFIIIFIILCLIKMSKTDKNSSNVNNKEKYSSVLVSDEMIDDTSRIIANNVSNGEVCLNSICIDHLNVISYPNEGLIEYDLYTVNRAANSGYLKIIINDKPIVFYHDYIETNSHITGFFTYDGFSLGRIRSYSLEELEPEDYVLIY